MQVESSKCWRTCQHNFGDKIASVSFGYKHLVNVDMQANAKESRSENDPQCGYTFV